MEKPNVRGGSPNQKAHLALGDKLNRKSKPPPPLPMPDRVPEPVRGPYKKRR